MTITVNKHFDYFWSIDKLLRMAHVKNTITIAGATEAKQCSRGAVMYAIRSGVLATEQTRDGATLIICDAAYEAWTPSATGKRGRPKASED